MFLLIWQHDANFDEKPTQMQTVAAIDTYDLGDDLDKLLLAVQTSDETFSARGKLQRLQRVFNSAERHSSPLMQCSDERRKPGEKICLL